MAIKNITCTDLTIPTGGTLTANSSTVTCSGDFTASGGLIGKSAYDFNGASGYITCGSDSSIDNIFYGGGTIETWINIDSDGESDTGQLLEKRWSLKTIQDDGTNYRLMFSYGFGSVNGIWSTVNRELTLGKWHHVAITYNGGADANNPVLTNDPTLWIDGKQVALSEDSIPAGTTQQNDSGDNMHIGGNGDDTVVPDGRIAMVRVFDDVRTEAELRADMFSSSFSDSTCDVTNTDATVTCDANKDIKAGQVVYADSGTPFIGTGTTVASITESGGAGTGVTSFELSASASETHGNTTLIFNRMANAGNLVAFYQFDEGTGTSLKDRTINANTGTITAGGSAWAGGGAFTYGTSEVVMNGGYATGYQKVTVRNDFTFYKFTVNAGKYVEIATFPPATEVVLFRDDFTVNGTLKTSAQGATGTGERLRFENTFAGNANFTIGGSADVSAVNKFTFAHTSDTINLPAMTTRFLNCSGNGGTVQATGDITSTIELEIASGHTFNANGNTIAAKIVDVNGGTLDLSNSALNFSVTYVGDTFDLTSASTLTTGNTTITGNATNKHTPSDFHKDGGFEVVGDVKWLNVVGDLTVIGAVTDCSFDSSSDNIRQWHHTLDTQQLLDADEAGDDDLRLTKPALDNAHELMTG